MLALAIDINYPSLFAASFIVAGQWDPSQVRPLVPKPLFVVVSEGDPEAYPTEYKVIAAETTDGAKISRANWDAKAGTAALNANAHALIARGNSINYTVFKNWSVITAGAVDNP
jgi:predicted peptidase